jgi:two-component system, sensor histidine kinase
MVRRSYGVTNPWAGRTNRTGYAGGAMHKTQPDTTINTPSQLRAAVAREQLQILLTHTQIGVFAATAFAALVAYRLLAGTLATIAPHLVLGWFAVKLAVVMPRVVAAHLARSPNARTAEFAGRCTVPLLALDGAVWGVGAAALMGGPVESWSLIAAFICCVACIATFGLGVRLAATAAYCVPMIAPPAVALLVHGGGAADTAAIGLTLVISLLLLTSLRSERRIREFIALRFHSDQISAERAAALALANRHSQAKDRFLAIVSHELRTPLHGILGLTRLTISDLPKVPITVNAHYRLGLIEDAGLHLQRMVNDLLDISFMESGRLQLHPAPFHLLHELSVITETYAARASEVGIGFAAYIQPSLEGLVSGDSARIAQVLHNLLGNAFKFTLLGGKITLEVERIHATSTIQFLVRDTGPGVPESERDTIFEIFAQGSVAGNRPDGVGLGLAISRQLAREMDGDVVCRSGGLVGSAFVFTATLPHQLAAVGHPPAAPPAMAVARRSQYVGLTVYLADDDPGSALVAGSVIRSLDCDLESFVNGAELLERFITTSERPDAIVLDWDMPMLDGRSTALAIRHHERLHDLRPVPIIGLSANPAPSFSLAGLTAGMTVFLTKPCSPLELAGVLTAHLGRDAVFSLESERTSTGWTTD